MNLEELKRKHITDYDVERAANAIKNGKSEAEVYRHLKDLNGTESVILKFELIRWLLIPLVAMVAYALSNNVESGSFLHQAAGYVFGMCMLGFAMLSFLINSNKVSAARHKTNIATMIAILESGRS